MPSAEPHDAGGVLETEYYSPFTRVTTTQQPRQRDSTNCTSWRSNGSSSCLDESPPQWVPAGHPRYTGARTRGSVGGSQDTHTAQRVHGTRMTLNTFVSKLGFLCFSCFFVANCKL